MRSRAILLLLAGLVVIGASSPAMGQTYTLTVDGGTAGAAGPHAASTSVSIVATVPPGKGFAFWLGDIAGVDDVNAASTFIIMPAADATVTAVSVPLTPNRVRLREGGGDIADMDPDFVDTEVDDISLQFRAKTQQYGVSSGGTVGTTNPYWQPEMSGQLDEAVIITDFDQVYGGAVLMGYGEMFDIVPLYKPGHTGDANYAVQISKAELIITSWSSQSPWCYLSVYRMLTPWMLGAPGTNEYRVFSDCIDIDGDGVATVGVDEEWITSFDGFPTMYADTTGGVPSSTNSKNSFGELDYDANTEVVHLWKSIATLLGANTIDVSDLVRTMYTDGVNEGFCLRITAITNPIQWTNAAGQGRDPREHIQWMFSEYMASNPPQGRPELRIQYSWPDEPGTPVELTVNSGSGGGWTSVGMEVTIDANSRWDALYFYDWVGDVNNVADTSTRITTITMDTSAATITATYGPGYSITCINTFAAMPPLVKEGAIGSLQSIYGPVNHGGMIFDQYVGDANHLLDKYTVFTYARIPAYDITVTATYGIPAGLDVTGGTPSGDYAVGRSVTIKVNPIATDYLFKEWVGEVEYLSNPYSGTTTATIPEDGVAVTATVDLAQGLTVISGAANLIPEIDEPSMYVLGGVASLVADIPPQDMVFSHWTGDVNDMADVNARITTLTMNADCTVTANYVNDSIDDADMVYKTVLKDGMLDNHGTGYPTYVDFRPSVTGLGSSMSLSWGGGFDPFDANDPADGKVHLEPILEFDISDIAAVDSVKLWVYCYDGSINSLASWGVLTDKDANVTIYRGTTQFEESGLSWFNKALGVAKILKLVPRG